MATRLPERWTQEEMAELSHEGLLEYEGDSRCVDDLMECGLTREAAQAEVQEEEFLKFYLSESFLPEILADRLASKALRIAILSKTPDILEVLAAATKRLRPKRKRGPKAKGGKYLYDKVLEMKMGGDSYGKIAMAIYGKRDEAGTNRVKALCRLAKKKRSNLVAEQFTTLAG